MQKILIVIGFLIIIIGLIYPWLKRLNIGHLPGDIVIKKANFTFYFPFITCLLVSLILSLLFWWLNK